MPEPTRRPVGFGRRIDDPPTKAEDPAVDAVPGAANLDEPTAAALIPTRDERGHKGVFGKLLVLAGSLDYAGAALLVCRAAGRAGAGLVTLAVPESLQPLFAMKIVEATTMALPEDDVEEVDPEPALSRILDHEHDALVIGPGLRPGLATAELIAALVGASGEDNEGRAQDGAGAERTPARPAAAVVDAEALRALASLDGWWESVGRPLVLTPHVGEFRRLRSGSGADADADGDLIADDAARARAAAAAAAQWRQVVVLKGARTVVASPDGPVSIAPFSNPALASGGTGDVLAGTIGALLAQGLPPFDAARLGVYLHGSAGEAVRSRLGDAGLLASDLVDELPYARKRLAFTAKKKPARKVGFGSRDREEPPG